MTKRTMFGHRDMGASERRAERAAAGNIVWAMSRAWLVIVVVVEFACERSAPHELGSAALAPSDAAPSKRQRDAIADGHAERTTAGCEPMVASEPTMTDAIFHDIPIGRLPATIEDFVVLRDRIATTPQGGAAAFAIALACYARDPSHGLAYVTISVASDLLDDDPDGYKGRSPRRAIVRNLRDRIDGKTHIPRSYVQGTRCEAGYVLPDGDLVVRVKQQRDSVQSADRAKMFVYSTGADTPRPVSLARNAKGLWKATEWSSLEVGVRAPGGPVGDDL